MSVCTHLECQASILAIVKGCLTDCITTSTQHCSLVGTSTQRTGDSLLFPYLLTYRLTGVSHETSRLLECLLQVLVEECLSVLHMA